MTREQRIEEIMQGIQDLNFTRVYGNMCLQDQIRLTNASNELKKELIMLEQSK